MKALLVIPVALSLGSAANVAKPRSVNWSAIVKIQCGIAVGTAFHIGNGRYITAAHVTTNGECAINGVPAPLKTELGDIDFAEVEGLADRPALEVDCAGFKTGRQYLAAGYAGGILKVALPLLYTVFGKDPESGNRQFIGADVIPGMSGGPTFNEGYRVTGINLQRWPSRSRPLSETPVCGASHA